MAISTCHGFSGIIYDGKKLMYIEPAEGRVLLLDLVVITYSKADELSPLWLFELYTVSCSHDNSVNFHFVCSKRSSEVSSADVQWTIGVNKYYLFLD